MLKILIKFAVRVLQFMNLFFKPLSLKNKVTIVSRQSDEPTLDIKLLEKALKEQGVKVVVLTKTLNRNIKVITSYCLQIIIQMYHIATSKVVVIDSYCILISVLPKKKDQKVVQMWHALGAIKKFGWQNVDNPDGHSKDVAEALYMHRNYDYILAPSVITGEFFAEAFRAPKKNIVYYGLPRIDFICDDDNDTKKKIECAYADIKRKTNILYAPTFRKNSDLELEKLIFGFDFKKYNLIIKKHFLDKGDYSWAEEIGAIVDNKFSSIQWLHICDKIITDYSAIVFEAAILDKPIYIHQPDVDDYVDSVGINVDLCNEAIGEYVSRTESELFNNLNKTYDSNAVIAFRKKFIEIDTESCTQKLCDFLKSLLTE